MLQFSIQKLPIDYLLEIKDRIILIRKQQKITQEQLAKQSGVSYGSIKRFEKNGQISFQHLLMIAHALNIISDLDNIFIHTEKSDLSKHFDI